MVAVVLGQKPAGPLRHGAGEQARRRIAKSFELDDMVAGGCVGQKKPGAAITGCHFPFPVAGASETWWMWRVPEMRLSKR
jgi:hypothetical protein